MPLDVLERHDRQAEQFGFGQERPLDGECRDRVRRIVREVLVSDFGEFAVTDDDEFVPGFGHGTSCPAAKFSPAEIITRGLRGGNSDPPTLVGKMGFSVLSEPVPKGSGAAKRLLLIAARRVTCGYHAKTLNQPSVVDQFAAKSLVRTACGSGQSRCPRPRHGHDRGSPAESLLDRLTGIVILRETHLQISADPRRRQSGATPVTGAAEWLLDNFHIITEALREVRTDLAPGYYAPAEAHDRPTRGTSAGLLAWRWRWSLTRIARLGRGHA